MHQSQKINEQKFAELVESIKFGSSNEETSSLTSFYSIQDIGTFQGEESQLKYEVTQNDVTSKYQFNLLNIEQKNQFQFETKVCIISDLNDIKLFKQIKNHIIKFSFQKYFFDFFQFYENTDDSFELSDSFMQNKISIFQNFAKTYSNQLRIVVFANKLNQAILEIIKNHPFIYYFSDSNIDLNENILKSLGLHQSVRHIDFEYENIRALIPQTFSILKDLFYAGIQIEIKVMSQSNEIGLSHPLLKITSQNYFTILEYNIPYIYQSKELQLPIPIKFDFFKIQDVWEIQVQVRMRNCFDNQNEITEYGQKLKQLNNIYEQIELQELFFSINADEQFYSMDKIIIQESIKEIEELKQKQNYRDESLEMIEEMWKKLYLHQDNHIDQLIDFLQLQHFVLYRMKSQNFLY